MDYQERQPRSDTRFQPRRDNRFQLPRTDGRFHTQRLRFQSLVTFSGGRNDFPRPKFQFPGPSADRREDFRGRRFQ